MSDSDPTAGTGESFEARYSVSAMLDALQQPAAAQPPCKATLSVYPGFEELTATVLNETDVALKVGFEMRQFLPEIFLLRSFLMHRCRVPHPLPGRPLGARDAQPHFYIIPVLWVTIAYTACSQPRWRAHAVARRAGAASWCPLAKRAVALASQLVRGARFRLDAEHHVLLHTSTAARVDVWGWDGLADALSDPRVIALHYEGRGGDSRPQAYRPAARTVRRAKASNPARAARRADLVAPLLTRAGWCPAGAGPLLCGAARRARGGAAALGGRARVRARGAAGGARRRGLPALLRRQGAPRPRRPLRALAPPSCRPCAATRRTRSRSPTLLSPHRRRMNSSSAGRTR